MASVFSTASMMTMKLAAMEPRRAVCCDCRGTKYDRRPGKAGACQRCRGEGSVRVGSTKR